ncbi:MAG: ammonium transporter, partial [Aureliella sp.]
FNSQKNAVNILFKNSMDVCVGMILFFVVGFGLMYPASYTGSSPNPYFGFGGFGLEDYAVAADRTFSPDVDWFFQAVFAATAATIVSGAVAGRMKVVGYLIYSAALTAFIYPISGYWKWGGGWLTQFGTANEAGEFPMAFQDFAGSAVVHGVGGFAALAGAVILGPRIGRFVKGKSIPMPGHSIPIAALGVFILWFGWYGFNPGSQLAFQSTSDIDAVMHIAVTTSLAAAAGGLMASFVSWGVFGKPDLSMGLNGILGGLVGITAGCDCMSTWMSLVVGAVAGVVVILGVLLLDKLQIDDPVGAFPVHGMCGVWGCMAIGILPNAHLESGSTNFMVQLIGTASICGWSLFAMSILFCALRVTGLLRVTPEEEFTGLDISEHGMHAYPPEGLARTA